MVHPNPRMFVRWLEQDKTLLQNRHATLAQYEQRVT